MEPLDRSIFDAWRSKAEEDFAAAELLTTHHGPPATICFLCQQTAEKYLKAFLLLRGKPLKRIHHLDALLEDCMTLDPLTSRLMESATLLKRYYIASRYPDDIPEDVSAEEAAEALAAATQIREFILDRVL